MSLLTQTEPNNQATFTGGVSIIKDVLTQDAGNLTVANITNTQLLGGGVQNGGVTGASLATLATNGTILTAGRVARISASAAVTGITIQNGVVDGQDFTLQYLGTSQISISAGTAATSFTGPVCLGYMWDAGQTLWYHKS